MEDVAAPGLRQAGLVHRRNTGRATRRTVGSTMRQINRWTFGPVGPGGLTTQIHINGHRGPAPLEPTAGVSQRLCARGSDSAD
jgi:hypothetical protein